MDKDLPTPRRSRWLANLLVLVVSTLVGIGLLEFGLRVALNPAEFLQVSLVDDPILGHRIEPSSPGYDALGFRNAEVPRQADIVAIGDSTTFGISATRDMAWPPQLGRLLGERVYNMGLGGYGPLQYLQLLQSSVPAMKPRVVIVGFYFGNDLMDSYYVAHGRPHWHAWRMSEGVKAGTTPMDEAGRAAPKKRFGALRDWLSRHSLLYSVIRATLLQRFALAEQQQMAVAAGPDARVLWKDRAAPAVQTTFAPKQRLTAVDMDLAPVREGMQISQRAFGELAKQAQRDRVGLLTVLIPTKEHAYCRYMAKSGDVMVDSFAKLCAAETKANTEIKAYLAAQGIEHLDLLPVLQDRIERHMQVYPMDIDGHPNAAGYGVIAEAIAAVVRQRFPRTGGAEPAK